MKNYNLLNERVNEIRIMNNGLKATIIKYNNANNIDIQFENGQILKKIQYHRFKKGGIKCPLIIKKYNNHLKITNENINPKFEFTIDSEDSYILDYGLWSPDAYGYAENKNGKKLHRLIMNAPKGMSIDHINGDKSDNRKSNLRICTNSENLRNRGSQSNNTSGYKGVSWSKELKKWRTQICINKKHIHVGLFKDKIEAAKAYNEAAIKYHGEFAKLNEIR